ncbi:hypothetical protein DPMN_041614 [Dreissena polymorpha]|uniref:Uncharacterized protein n=1 Tax=Dreissena polymorpha TaxID=45954 RepID=A0A9D4D0J6_DREPO|nr:hypothetical protein DPMN_041614 [Dreissena polymorpha]
MVQREDCIHRHGVAFIVRKEVVNSVIICKPISVSQRDPTSASSTAPHQHQSTKTMRLNSSMKNNNAS